MKNMELKRSEHCSGFKNCHESFREYDAENPECAECLEDAIHGMESEIKDELYNLPDIISRMKPFKSKGKDGRIIICITPTTDNYFYKMYKRYYENL